MIKKTEIGTTTLLCSDVSDALKTIADESVQLVVTSPPYNLGKEYERDRSMSLNEYLEWLQPIVSQLCNKVSSTGSICWQVGNHVRNGQVFPLDVYFYEMFLNKGLKLRNRVIWRFNFGLHAQKRLSGRYETLLWFTRGEDYTFNLDRIRIPQLYPGKKHSSRKGPNHAGLPSGNPAGKNPSDFWEFDAEEHFINSSVWEIPNVKANHPEYTCHPCQFPNELAERCVLAFSNENDVVLDPFVGSGTTLIAATKNHRKSIGIDKNPTYIEIATARLSALRAGELKLRPSGKGVLRPSPEESVARVPQEWLELSGSTQSNVGELFKE